MYKKDDPSQNFGYRHGLMILCFFGAMVKQSTRVGLSVAMVSMVRTATVLPTSDHFGNGTNQTVAYTCPGNRQGNGLTDWSANSTISIVRIRANPHPMNAVIRQVFFQINNTSQFDWDSKTQGFLHGAFYCGYLFSQIPGGWLAHRIGATKPIAASAILIGIATILSPLAAYWGVWFFFVMRLAVGVGTVSQNKEQLT